MEALGWLRVPGDIGFSAGGLLAGPGVTVTCTREGANALLRRHRP